MAFCTAAQSALHRKKLTQKSAKCRSANTELPPKVRTECRCSYKAKRQFSTTYPLSGQPAGDQLHDGEIGGTVVAELLVHDVAPLAAFSAVVVSVVLPTRLRLVSTVNTALFLDCNSFSFRIVISLTLS